MALVSFRAKFKQFCMHIALFAAFHVLVGWLTHSKAPRPISVAEGAAAFKVPSSNLRLPQLLR